MGLGWRLRVWGEWLMGLFTEGLRLTVLDFDIRVRAKGFGICVSGPTIQKAGAFGRRRSAFRVQ